MSPSFPIHVHLKFMFTISSLIFFFFNVPATTEIYTLSLHDALPICPFPGSARTESTKRSGSAAESAQSRCARSEEHTSELQSLTNLVCRLLLEKKKKKKNKKKQIKTK